MPFEPGGLSGFVAEQVWCKGWREKDLEAYREFIASPEVAAFAHLLDEQRLPEIADIIRKIASDCGYRETAEQFQPAFEAFQMRMLHDR